MAQEPLQSYVMSLVGLSLQRGIIRQFVLPTKRSDWTGAQSTWTRKICFNDVVFTDESIFNWSSSPADSPDLNPIEYVWGFMKTYSIFVTSTSQGAFHS